MLLRRVRAGDAERVQQFVRALSARSRLERFLAPVSELSVRQLERITSGTGLCLAVFDERGRIVALAEYACADATGAELAIAVADAWQGRGLGRRLLARLVRHAARAGVARLEGVTRVGNAAMQRLASELGFRLRRDADPRLMRFERAGRA
ncbi:MAG TPA: GNAT family N-acetyltransferase [Burkholderiales bacterium]|jgi:acetyltransferase|nr:GNAT family N-acetyltransferase [Burkholderiales bacterium]